MLTLKVENYKCLKCGKEILVAHEVIVVKLGNGQELVVDTATDPICECGSPMFSEGLLRVMNNSV